MRWYLIVAALGLALVASACRTTRPSGAHARTVEGRVEDVGRDDGTLTLAVGDEHREILVAPEAEIRIDDFKATFDDIQEGQRVRASLDETGGQKEGFRIQILDQGLTAPGGAEVPANPDRRPSSAESDRP